MLISNTIVIGCLIAVIGLIIYLQYAMGVMQASVSTALILPLSYGTLMFILTGIVAGYNSNSLLFVVSQLIVAYWFYWLYEWGTTRPQPADESPTEKVTTPILNLKKQK